MAIIIREEIFLNTCKKDQNKTDGRGENGGRDREDMTYNRR
jgi:hypothetical protein